MIIKNNANFYRRIKAAAAISMCVLCIMSLFAVAAVAAGINDTGIHARDPFVLEYEGTYYMYGSEIVEEGYGCVYSQDLKEWSEPVTVFAPDEDFDGIGEWWAPECHYYKGAFYLFASYHSAASDKRGTAIFRADNPLGPFEVISGGHITPKDRDCIDGTLYIDEEGQPWMIYVGEWTSNDDGIGDMMAAKMSDDLTELITEPILLFRGDSVRERASNITDGPFLYRTKNGRLIMIWSYFAKTGYCVQVAYSSNGRIDGKWIQQPGCLYEKTDKHADGGHGMFFTAPDGTLTMAIHSPNFAEEDNPITAVFVPVTDIGDTVITMEDDNLFVRTRYWIYYLIMTVVNYLSFGA